MPYIKKEQRQLKDYSLCRVINEISSYGDLNYIITKLCQAVVETKGECYDTYNSLVGALECCKLEMYRRAIARYEDKKKEENSDVY